MSLGRYDGASFHSPDWASRYRPGDTVMLRIDLGPPSVWQARTKRCVDNHREGLIMFAPLILIAHVVDVHTWMTLWGAQLFFYSRVAHAVIYLAGLPLIRPIPWTIGMVGIVMVFLALFGIGA